MYLVNIINHIHQLLMYLKSDLLLIIVTEMCTILLFEHLNIENKLHVFEQYIKEKVIVSLAQFVWTMHKICKVWGSNPDHHQKIYIKEKMRFPYHQLQGSRNYECSESCYVRVTNKPPNNAKQIGRSQEVGNHV